MNELIRIKNECKTLEEFFSKTEDNYMTYKRELLKLTKLLDEHFDKKRLERLTRYHRLVFIWFGYKEISKCEFCGKYANFYFNTKDVIENNSLFTKTCGDSACKNKMREATWKDKYGYDNPSKIPAIKENNREKFIKNIDSFNAKRVKTWKDKYGYDNPSKVEEIRTRCNFSSSKTSFDKRMNNNYELLERNNDIYRLKCKKCDKEFEIFRYYLYKRFNKNEIICTYCNPLLTHKSLTGKSVSGAEMEFLGYIESIYDGLIIHSDRKILDKSEIDVYLPDLKLGFEFNGCYWHSDKWKDKYYHRDKKLKAWEKEVDLIHIWEDEWETNLNETKQVISDLINRKQNPIINNKLDENMDYCLISSHIGQTINEITEPILCNYCNNNMFRKEHIIFK